MEIDTSLLNLVVASILPFLVALVTKKVADSSVKGVLLAVLSGATAAVTAAIDDSGVFTQETLALGVQNFVVATAAYYGLWNPTSLTNKVADATSGFGVTIKEKPE